MFFYEFTSFPGIFFFQTNEFLIFLRILFKLLDADRRQAGNDSIFSYFRSHFLGTATRNPSTSRKADDGQYNCTAKSTTQTQFDFLSIHLDISQ